MGYSKEVYRQARQTLDRRRETAQNAAAARKAALYDALPRLQELEQELAHTGLNAARAAISRSPDVEMHIRALEQKNAALQQERGALLAQAELPADSLAAHYSCSICQDTGRIGQAHCACFEQLLRQIACRKVSESGGIDGCRLDNFSLDYYPDQPGSDSVSPRQAMRRVFSRCQDYVAHFPGSGESLLFFGNTGLGKTHLSLAIAYEVIQRGYGVYYTSCQRLMDRLQAQQFGRGPVDDADYQQTSLSCDLLILDDLGAEFSTSFTIAVLQNIINTRLTELRPTIVSTNFDIELLSERYGERIVSRLLCAYQPLPFYGDDIRKLKRFSR